MKTKSKKWFSYLVRLNLILAVVWLVLYVTYPYYAHWLYQTLAPHCVGSADSECYLGVGWGLFMAYAYSFIGIITLGIINIVIYFYINKKNA